MGFLFALPNGVIIFLISVFMHWCILSFGFLELRPVVVSFAIERMRLSLSPHPQNSVIAWGRAIFGTDGMQSLGTDGETLTHAML